MVLPQTNAHHTMPQIHYEGKCQVWKFIILNILKGQSHFLFAKGTLTGKSVCQRETSEGHQGLHQGQQRPWWPLDLRLIQGLIFFFFFCFHYYFHQSLKLLQDVPIAWVAGKVPPDMPRCGFKHELCKPPEFTLSPVQIAGIVLGSLLLITSIIGGIFYR